MKEPRRLALNAERLTELSTGELREVNGAGTLSDGICLTDPRYTYKQVCDVSRIGASICDCATEYCG